MASKEGWQLGEDWIRQVKVSFLTRSYEIKLTFEGVLKAVHIVVGLYANVQFLHQLVFSS